MSGGEEREGSPLPWGAASNPAGEEEEVLISEFRWADMRFKSDLHNLQLLKVMLWRWPFKQFIMLYQICVKTHSVPVFTQIMHSPKSLTHNYGKKEVWLQACCILTFDLCRELYKGMSVSMVLDDSSESIDSEDSEHLKVGEESASLYRWNGKSTCDILYRSPLPPSPLLPHTHLRKSCVSWSGMCLSWRRAMMNSCVHSANWRWLRRRRLQR